MSHTAATIDKSITDLRKECKEIGVTISKKTMSWGPHISFKIEGIDVESVMSKEFYEQHQNKFEQLVAIRTKFVDMKINGQKIYGIKSI